MQTLPLGLSAAAATPVAQRHSETDPAHHENAAQARQAAGEKQAEKASGIGQTDQDQPAFDRDADGRRLWEIGQAPEQDDEEESPPVVPQAKDPSGQSGTQLDMSG